MTNGSNKGRKEEGRNEIKREKGKKEGRLL